MQKESTVAPTPLGPPDQPARGVISTGAAALEGMRPYQWLKNTLVFVPLIAAHRLGRVRSAARRDSRIPGIQLLRLRDLSDQRYQGRGRRSAAPAQAIAPDRLG